MLSCVLVKVRTGFDAAIVADNIRRWTGLAAYTQAEFKDSTTRYLIRNIPAFTVFSLSTIIAFIVGGLIARPIFYNFTPHNPRYLGGMKALGPPHPVLRPQ